MKIIPAVDIINNQIVRLTKGNFDDVKIYHSDAIEFIKKIDELKFTHLHIVDLLGSKKGEINILDLLAKIKLETKLRLQFGGGIRNEKDIKKLVDIGVDSIIIGSLSISNKDIFEKIVLNYGGEKFIVAIDVLNYEIMIHGWKTSTGINLFDHIKYCSKLGLNTFLCTDINKDGMLQGVNTELYKEILQRTEINLIASGGISDISDIISLKNISPYGVVVGKAIYENKIDLKELSKYC